MSVSNHCLFVCFYTDSIPPFLFSATNIAETSITIDDIVHVVDSGRVKETGFEPSTRMATLLEGWVCAASAQQRKGRAGRVRPGVAWRMYSKATFNRFPAHAPAEMLRVPLEGALLAATALRAGGALLYPSSLLYFPPF